MKIVDQIMSKDLMNDVFTRINIECSSVYIYGCGNSGIQISRKIDPQNIRAFVVADERWKIYGENYKVDEKYPVIPLSEMKTFSENGFFLVSLAPSDEITDDIEHVVKNKKIFYLDGQQMLFPKLKYEYVRDNVATLQKLWLDLDDQYSKDLLLAYINARISGDLSYMRDYSRETRKNVYFDSNIFEPRENEVLIDCGAYEGDSIEDFVRFTKYKYKKIWAFEPNDKNFDKLINIQRRYENIELVKKGCWNEASELHFNSEKGPMSEINNVAEEIIQVDRIDRYCGDDEITFIKMNIEGSEYNALLGAKHVIQSRKPRLAISVYHRPEDLFRIPQLLQSFVPEYKMKLRVYSYGTGLLVLYASVD